MDSVPQFPLDLLSIPSQLPPTPYTHTHSLSQSPCKISGLLPKSLALVSYLYTEMLSEREP